MYQISLLEAGGMFLLLVGLCSWMIGLGLGSREWGTIVEIVLPEREELERAVFWMQGREDVEDGALVLERRLWLEMM